MCQCHVYVLASLLIVNIQKSVQDCLLPEHPGHGKHLPLGFLCPPGNASSSSECRGVPGTRVPDLWLLSTQCDNNYVPVNQAPLLCQKNKWVPVPGGCVNNKTSTVNHQDYAINKPGESGSNHDGHKSHNMSQPASGSGCILPHFPAHGSYNGWFCTENLEPGNAVDSDCVLLFSCNSGYEFSGRSDKKVSVICNSSGVWVPHPAELICKPGLYQPTTTQPVKKPTNNNRNCVLPQISDGRIFYSHCEDQSQGDWCLSSPGSTPPSGVVNVTCQEGYGLSPIYSSVVSNCRNDGNWSPEIPKCTKLCPLLQSETTDASCFYRQSRLPDCEGPLFPGITMMPECRQGYTKIPDLVAFGRYERLTCRQGGTWNHQYLPECKPICGISRGNTTMAPLVIDGKDTKLGQFPWHAGIYKLHDPNTTAQQWDNICGGSLISKKIILTAAHCVVDSQLQKTSPNHLQVALGKYYRSWTHDEPDSIKRQVIDMKVPDFYEGGKWIYSWDIALLLLDRVVESTYYIMPVCMIPQENRVTEGATGFVPGWGNTEDTSAPGHESETLLSSNIDLVSYENCGHLVKSIFLLPHGKFCGVKNAVNTSVVQKGDSGGGLTVDIGGLHYIVGLVSTKVQTDQSFISVFTNVSSGFQKDWLRTEIRKLSY